MSKHAYKFRYNSVNGADFTCNIRGMTVKVFFKFFTRFEDQVAFFTVNFAGTVFWKFLHDNQEELLLINNSVRIQDYSRSGLPVVPILAKPAIKYQNYTK